MKKAVLAVLIVASLGLVSYVLTSHYNVASVGKPLKDLPVQDAGRIKPYDTFATEALQLVYGKKSFRRKEGAGLSFGKEGAADEGPSKLDAVDVVTTWMLVPEQWDQMAFVEVRHSGLREALRLANERTHYSPQELMANDRVGLIIQELRSRQERQEKLDPYFQAVQRLQNQLTLYNATKAGMLLRLVPSHDSDAWTPVARLEGDLRQRFGEVRSAFIKAIAARADGNMTDEEKAQLEQQLAASVGSFKQAARNAAPDKYADPTKIAVEVHYNDFHPFQWSWIAYLFAGIFFIARGSQRGLNYALGWAFLVVGFGLHTYGMGLRVFLTGRPPVSNMYETVVWVPWGAVLFAMILEWMKKSVYLVLPAATGIAVLCLILTDLAPSVLDGSIQPLEPVLRSTFWLTTHVLIITISYAAFFLAMGIGNVLMFLYLKDEKKYRDGINKATQVIYRCIQIGSVLLAAGIILGGVWADYSWGRFWGWDPKETWALIAFLGYVAILHAKIAGWIRQFGMAAWAVISFSLVIMAWYGVNFVLGAGLHSYGFGAGGVEQVSVFVAAEILFVAFVATVRQSRKKQNTKISTT